MFIGVKLLKKLQRSEDMDTLRVLLVENDRTESERIAERLELANHSVLPASSLLEAAQALEIQQFDAIMLTSRAVGADLLAFRTSLSRFEQGGKMPVRIPLLCYTPVTAEQPTDAELLRYEIGACLPKDFEAVTFTQLVSKLALGLNARHGGDTQTNAPLLPIFQAHEFQEQVGFDHELVVEIIDIFFSDLEAQVDNMQHALQVEDLLTLSRVAHSLKGSLGSLYATQAASTAQTLEQAARTDDRESAAAALARLEAELQALKPELLSLRNADPGS